MPHTHSIKQLLALAESLDEDGQDWAVVRELKVQARACAKDEEDRKAAA